MFARFCLTLVATAALAAPALARCACLDTPDEAARRAREEEALRRLPSQAKLELARGFAQQQLYEDAGRTYKEAVEAAESEVSAAASSAASETALAQHAADVDREAAAFFAGTGDLRSAALLKEKALVHELALDKVENRESAYTGLAQTFEAAGDHRKAAEYYQKLADLLAATRGRYHSLTAAANRNYKRNLSQAQRSGSTL